MTNPTQEELNLYIAVAELAYAISLTDNEVSTSEIDIFQKTIREALGVHGRIAQMRFTQIHRNPPQLKDIDASYLIALQIMEENKFALNRVLIRKFIYILEQVASVMGVSEAEKKIIDKFEDDVIKIHASKRSEKIQLAPEVANLYSTIGQLAYVIAKADNILMQEERETFRKVIKEKLGDFDWLAEERFKIIDDMMILDVESTYEHALYLIRKNIKGLDESIIQKFIYVVTEIANVAGLHRMEEALLIRFQEDIYEIFANK
jgi:uncharacterized tellurite resistance protein B-like protein